MKKQDSIALNTQEAEIKAGSLAACEIIFIRGLSEEHDFPLNGPTTLYMDNTSAIDLANDPMGHSTSKHIARRDLFIRELIERGAIKPEYVKSANNTADALTKPLARIPFQKHRRALLGM